MAQTLKGHVALVTGSTTGLGLGIAKVLGAGGAKVVMNYYNDDEKYCKECLLYTKKPCLPKMINNVCAYQPRTDMILQLIKTNYEVGRKVLILSDRRAHLDCMIGWLLKEGIPIHGPDLLVPLT